MLAHSEAATKPSLTPWKERAVPAVALEFACVHSFKINKGPESEHSVVVYLKAYLSHDHRRRTH